MRPPTAEKKPHIFNSADAGFEIADAAESLRQGEVVIVLAQTAEPTSVNTTLLFDLEEAEILRFHSYKSLTAATQFLQARALLRKLMSNYMGVSAGQIEVSCEENVKPTARCIATVNTVPQFNISHSGTWVVLAAHRTRPIGIDVECPDQQEINTLSTMPDLFTRTERAKLALCADYNKKANLFYQLWRSKEAIMKATGRGFDLAPASFEVLTKKGLFKTVVEVEGQNWNLQQVALCRGLECAIAIGAN